MQSSVRVAPACMVMGQAAGVAASMSVQSGDVRDMGIEKLRGRLKDMDVFLG